MTVNYGTEQRTKPRLKVLRGWDPNNPTNRTARAPIATGVTIKSGQVISLHWNNGQQEWSLGVTDGVADIPHFAVQDGDDFDVLASGVLTGLSSLDNIELQTPYYTASPTPAYGLGTPLKANGTTGNVTTQLLTATTTPDSILGYTSRFNGPVDVKGEDSSSVPDGDGKVLVLTLMTGFQRNAVADA